MVLSVAIHAAFIAMAEWAVGRRAVWLSRVPSLSWLAGTLCAVSLWLMASMSLTVWLWALYFLWIGAFGDLETAVYFSIVSFTTLGFGDIVLDRPHRILSGDVCRERPPSARPHDRGHNRPDPHVPCGEVRTPTERAAASLTVSPPWSSGRSPRSPGKR